MTWWFGWRWGWCCPPRTRPRDGYRLGFKSRDGSGGIFEFWFVESSLIRFDDSASKYSMVMRGLSSKCSESCGYNSSLFSHFLAALSNYCSDSPNQRSSFKRQIATSPTRTKTIAEILNVSYRINWSPCLQYQMNFLQVSKFEDEQDQAFDRPSK